MIFFENNILTHFFIMIKKSLIFTATVFVICFLASSCSTNQSTISGTIQNIDSLVNLTVLHQGFSKTEEIKTVKLTPKKSTFKFKVGELTEPTFFQLRVSTKGSSYIVLLLNPSDKAELTIDLNDFTNYTVTGSPESIKTKHLTNRLAKTVNSLDSLTSLINRSSTVSEKLMLSQQYESIIDKQRAFSTQFIWDSLMSRASVMALYQKVGADRFVFDRAEDIQLFKAVATSLIARFPESDYAKGMLRDIKNQEKIVFSHRLQELVKNAEASLPDIALPNPKGDTIRLSSLKGKVILLDFWASFNQDNLLENRELLQLYSKYNRQGFEIYQVSVDYEREAWLAAIESGPLPWINVSELDTRGSLAARLFNVTNLPANYLISRNHDIVAKNIYGKDLEKKLKELL